MKKIDIILCGVGGQGILSIATVIGEAATSAGLYLKQAEVHGMSQRGGDVQSNLRLSDCEICSDLIPTGKTDVIISMEPMEALRYIGFLSADGSVITSAEPFENIPDYPDKSLLESALSKLPKVRCLEIEKMAKENEIPRSANMILLGMAARSIDIVTPEQLKKAISTIFSSKGQAVVDANIKAFELGMNAASGK